MSARFAVLAVLACGPVAAAPVPKAIKSAGLDGTWEVTERHSRGRKVVDRYTIRWMIDGEQLTIERSSNGTPGPVPQPVHPPAYKLVRSAAAANALDYTIEYPTGGFSTLKGVYDLDGNTLQFCYTTSREGDRPAECGPADTTAYYVFKRVKPTDK